MLKNREFLVSYLEENSTSYYDNIIYIPLWERFTTVFHLSVAYLLNSFFLEFSGLMSLISIIAISFLSSNIFSKNLRGSHYNTVNDRKSSIFIDHLGDISHWNKITYGISSFRWFIGSLFITTEQTFLNFKISIVEKIIGLFIHSIKIRSDLVDKMDPCSECFIDPELAFPWSLDNKFRKLLHSMGESDTLEKEKQNGDVMKVFLKHRLQMESRDFAHTFGNRKTIDFGLSWLDKLFDTVWLWRNFKFIPGYFWLTDNLPKALRFLFSSFIIYSALPILM